MVKLLVILVIALVVIAIAQMMRVFELSRKFRKYSDASVTERENRFQSYLMLVFLVGYFAFFFWCFWVTKDRLLPVSGSEHGLELDWLLNFNFIIITAAFVLTHIVLFYFAHKYYGRKGRVAAYVTHDNRLELIWTVIPAVFMAVIIIYGLNAWNNITADPEEGSHHKIELYSYQFGWLARYPGADGELGDSDYNLWSGENNMAVATPATIDKQIQNLQDKIDLFQGQIDGLLDPNSKAGREFTKQRNAAIRQQKRVRKIGALEYQSAEDDIIVKDTFKLPVNKPVHFVFRSKDVIHSAFMPHFRAQMNTVPGTTTEFKFNPIYTTEQMREMSENPDFNYLLYCNKICGASHYNMQMVIDVVEEEEYVQWIESRNTVAGGPAGPGAAGELPPDRMLDSDDAAPAGDEGGEEGAEETAGLN